MTTTRKRLFTIKRLIDESADTISFTAYDLDGKPTGHRCRFEARKASEANRHYAMLHGFNQTIGDTAALGAGSSLEAKFKFMEGRIGHLESGAESWEASGREPGEGTLLFQALMRQQPDRDEAKVRAFVAALPRSKRDKMLADERLSDIVRALREESGKGIDAEELFAELDELGG